jgi:hypothetical protein
VAKYQKRGGSGGSRVGAGRKPVASWLPPHLLALKRAAIRRGCDSSARKHMNPTLLSLYLDALAAYREALTQQLGGA